MAPLRCDGLYVSRDPDGETSYLRFYEDGTVVDATTDDPIAEVAGWLERDTKPHILQTRCVVSGDSISFDFESREPPLRIEYAGTVAKNALALRVKSSTGYTADGVAYELISFDDIARTPPKTRQPSAPLATSVHVMYAAWGKTGERRRFHGRRFIRVRELAAAQRGYNTWIEDWLVDEVEKMTSLFVRRMVPFMQPANGAPDYCLFANQGDVPDAVYVWYHDQPGSFTLLAPSFPAFLEELRGRLGRGAALPP